MAIYRMDGDKGDLKPVSPTSFGETGVLERRDLQRILRDRPEILEDGLFILAEEFSNWQGSGRSIDLLALDQTGRLVVIELKRGETGEHMDLQAIRYAAMVSPLTFQQAITAHQAYLEKRGIAANAEEQINGHLENPESVGFSTAQPRIVLVSEGFSPELTTCVLWLNDNYGLGITCIRMRPYRNGAELLVETSQVIPLPEAADYLVRIRERENEAKQQRSSGSYTGSGDAFRDSIENAREEFQPDLTRLYQWAVSLEQNNLATLSTWPGQNISMQVTVPGKSALVSIRSYPNSNILFYASHFRRLAPNSIPLVDKLIGSTSLRDIQSSSPRVMGVVSDDLLTALTAAYREANGLPGDGDDGGE